MRNSRMTVLLALLTIFTLLSSCAKTDYDTTVVPDTQDSGLPVLTHIINPDSEVRGVWIASVSMPSSCKDWPDQIAMMLNSASCTLPLKMFPVMYFVGGMYFRGAFGKISLAMMA